MAEPNASSFLKILERSGIVAQDRLKNALDELSKNLAGKPVKTDALTSHLIQSGLLTEWHCDKLLAGKYKGFFLGKYKLLGHLGTGGMSSVYLAEHKLSGHKRAIKVLPRKKVSDKSYLDRFYREGKAAASLNHPNIVRIYDICQEGNTHYMVMEWVDGIDLYELVKKDGPLEFNTTAQYVRQACDGLSHAHRMQLVHRDIKPANLLLARDGTVKILDLGLALMREETESLTVLYNEKVMGTADYLAPEQAVNSHTVDHRADIYSLGCTMYYLLTGHPPFPEGTLAQRIAMHQTKEPAPITDSRGDCPEGIASICRLMMTKDVDQRLQNCTEVAEYIDTYLSTGSLPGNNGASFAIDTSGKKPEPEPSLTPAAPNANPDSPFAISTSIKKESGNASGKNKTTEKQKKLKPISTKAKSKSKANKPPVPLWVLALVIVFMFVALVLIVVIAGKFAT